MTNSEFVQQQARGLAESLLATDVDQRQRICSAYQRVYLRTPSEDELQRSSRFIEAYLGVLAEEKVPEKERRALAWASFARGLLTSNEFLFVD